MQRPGCLTPFGLLAGALTLAAVALSWLLAGGSMFSPGELNASVVGSVPLGGVRSHAEIGGNCAACHASPLGTRTMDQLCVDCHQDVQQQISAADGLHGGLDNAADCRSCHTEHGGADAALTTMDLRTFPHDQLGFSLAAHRQQADGTAFTCADCHRDAEAALPAARRYAFDPAVCIDCHLNLDADYLVGHVADFGDVCLACHDGIDRYTAFDHTVSGLPLFGRHAELTCSRCHATARTPEQFTLTTTTCFACHADRDIHQGQFGTDCASCHNANAWSDVTFDHMQTAFPLTGAHTDVACTSCHRNNTYRGTPTACVSCHVEPAVHLGWFGTQCNQCHTTTTWQGAIFEHRFPLTHGGQGTLSCATCHTNPQRYEVYTCYNCHAHPEAQTIAEHLREGIRGDISNCADCHADGRED